MNIDDSFLRQVHAHERERQQSLAMQRDFEETNRQIQKAGPAAAARKKAERDHDVAVMEEQTRSPARARNTLARAARPLSAGTGCRRFTGGRRHRRHRRRPGDRSDI
ncbi:hypothetical protein GS426_05795 [Rhodococcus hoagii]|nr:hypothetical protein [Prescottella equi]